MLPLPAFFGSSVSCGHLQPALILFPEEGLPLRRSGEYVGYSVGWFVGRNLLIALVIAILARPYCPRPSSKCRPGGGTGTGGRCDLGGRYEPRHFTAADEGRYLAPQSSTVVNEQGTVRLVPANPNNPPSHE